MRNQNCPIEALDHDIAVVSKDLNNVIDLWDAVKVLQADDPETTDRFNLTVQQAALRIGNAHSSDIKGETLDEVYDYLQSCEAGLREELQSFRHARAEFYAAARARTMEWIGEELKRLQEFPYDPTVTDDTRPDKIKVLKEVQNRLNDIYYED